MMQTIRFIVTISQTNLLCDSHQISIWARVRSYAWWTEIVNVQWGYNVWLENMRVSKEFQHIYQELEPYIGKKRTRSTASSSFQTCCYKLMQACN